MSVTFLVALVLCCVIPPMGPPEPGTEPIRLAGAALAMMATVSYALLVRLVITRNLLRDPDRALGTLGRYGVSRFVHGLLLAGAAAAIVHPFGWGWLVRETMGTGPWFGLDRLLLLAPWLIGEILSLAIFFGLNRFLRTIPLGGLHLPPVRFGLPGYILFQLRTHQGVWLLGSLMLAWLGDLAELASRSGWLPASAAEPVRTLGPFLILPGAPLLLRFAWSTRRMPDGPRRRFLEELARRLRFRASEILVWDTGRLIANAAVSGFVPQLRYVIVSDALLETLSDAEIGAVFGHEAGHVRHGHLPYFLAFLVLSSLMIGAGAQLADLVARDRLAPSWERAYELTAGLAIPELALTAAWFWFVFGRLSRLCERQADVYGCRAASLYVASSAPLVSFDPEASIGKPVDSSSGPPSDPSGAPAPLVIEASVLGIEVREPLEEPEDRSPEFLSQAAAPERDPPVRIGGVLAFARSMRRVAESAGLPVRAWSWRHGSIAERIAFVDRLIRDPDLADRFDRRCRWIRRLTLLGVALAAALFVGLAEWLYPGRIRWW
jgi:STE24 endopeptidase